MKPADAFSDSEAYVQARRVFVHFLSVLSTCASTENSVAAKNVVYHAEELLKSLDTFCESTDADA